EVAGEEKFGDGVEIVDGSLGDGGEGGDGFQEVAEGDAEVAAGDAEGLGDALDLGALAVAGNGGLQVPGADVASLLEDKCREEPGVDAAADGDVDLGSWGDGLEEEGVEGFGKSAEMSLGAADKSVCATIDPMDAGEWGEV